MKSHYDKPPYWAPPLDIFKLLLTLGSILALGVGWLNGCVSLPARPTIDTPQLIAGSSNLVTGSGSAGSTVKLLRNGEEVGRTQVGVDGKWHIPLPAAVAGTYALVARASANLTDVESNALSVEVTAPQVVAGQPIILTPLGGTIYAAKGDFGQISGKAPANSAIAVYDGETKLGAAQAGADGTWVLTLPALGLGAHTLIARVTGADGKDIASFPVNVVVEGGVAATVVAVAPTQSAAADPTATAVPTSAAVVAPTNTATAIIAAAPTTTPAATVAAIATPAATATAVAVVPAIAAPLITNIKNGDTLSTLQGAEIVGTAPARSTVEVYAGANKLGEAKANARGRWSLTTDKPLSLGKQTLTAIAVDKTSGAKSTDSQPVDVQVADIPLLPTTGEDLTQ